MKTIAQAMAILICVAGHASAWGSDAHRIIAEIAEQYLEPATVAKIRDVLAIENATSLAEVSTWADDIRRQRPETAPWHYVDIPIRPEPNVPEYLPEQDCPLRACVIAKIEDFAAKLRVIRTPTREKLEALKFVVHFVADVHQPLHAADDNDRGGNDIRVEFIHHLTNLHSVWDSGILARPVLGDDRSYALTLAASITPEQFEDWRGGTPVTWAIESHEIAKRVIYGRLAHLPGQLPASYEAEALPIVNKQLEKAGVRLAMLLNFALK